MNEKRIEQIKQNLEEKSTAELQKIQAEHDTNAWTDEAFEAIQRILTERDGKEPDLEEPRLPQRPKPTDNRARVGLILAGILLALGAIFLVAGKDDLAGTGGYLAAIGLGFIFGGLVGMVGGLIVLFGRARK
jgi:hypothetical protein